VRQLVLAATLDRNRKADGFRTYSLSTGFGWMEGEIFIANVEPDDWGGPNQIAKLGLQYRNWELKEFENNIIRLSFRKYEASSMAGIGWIWNVCFPIWAPLLLMLVLPAIRAVRWWRTRRERRARGFSIVPVGAGIASE
jgi:hypothetical protein